MEERINMHKLEEQRDSEKLTAKLINFMQSQEELNTILQLALVEIYEKENEKNV